MHLKLVSAIKVIYCLCCFFYGSLISNGLFQENLMILFSKSTLEKLSYENKDIILMGDFNIDILKYDTNNNSAAFLDMMYGNFLLP